MKVAGALFLLPGRMAANASQRQLILVQDEPMLRGIGFLWHATKGERLRPWRSAYLRWRLETYSGKKAETVGPRDFWNLFWEEKQQLFRFLRWTDEMKGYATPEKRI